MTDPTPSEQERCPHGCINGVITDTDLGGEGTSSYCPIHGPTPSKRCPTCGSVDAQQCCRGINGHHCWPYATDQHPHRFGYCCPDPFHTPSPDHGSEEGGERWTIYVCAECRQQVDPGKGGWACGNVPASQLDSAIKRAEEAEATLERIDGKIDILTPKAERLGDLAEELQARAESAEALLTERDTELERAIGEIETRAEVASAEAERVREAIEAGQSQDHWRRAWMGGRAEADRDAVALLRCLLPSPAPGSESEETG